MKQLILTALVSIICSVIAVKYLSNNAANEVSSSRPQTAAAGSERETQRKGMNREAVEGLQRNQKGQRGQGEGQGSKHGRGQGGSEVTRSQGKRHGDNTVSGSRGERENGAEASTVRGGNTQHSQGPTLAGFALNNVEQSIAKMTRKLALTKEQQTIVRALLIEYKGKLSEKRKVFTEAREAVLTLNILDADYVNAKERQQKRAVISFETLVALSTGYREQLYRNLDSTQSRILLSIENQQSEEI
ncbi:MAG: hypothetical protein VX078_21880 [Pseudomonadota bacterium]|nr:hypothetical protein [Pseudomonadota bacterium]